jgi:alpha-tubulin suppressor-like RCC1 family protein
VPGIAGATQIAAGKAHACALTSTGALLCWGDNSQGQLGDGTRTSRAAPSAVVWCTDPGKAN